MCTPISSRPLGSDFNEIASSKSFASAGSIVMVKTSRKSRRLLISSAGISSGNAAASFSACGEKARGKSIPARIDCISTRSSPGVPRTVFTSPKGLADCSGHSVITATTFCPFFAPLSFEFGMKMSSGIVLLSGRRKAKFFEVSMMPTNWLRFRRITSAISPSRLCPFRCGNRNTFTLSPCRA